MNVTVYSMFGSINCILRFIPLSSKYVVHKMGIVENYEYYDMSKEVIVDYYSY